MSLRCFKLYYYCSITYILFNVRGFLESILKDYVSLEKENRCLVFTWTLSIKRETRMYYVVVVQ